MAQESEEQHLELLNRCVAHLEKLVSLQQASLAMYGELLRGVDRLASMQSRVPDYTAYLLPIGTNVAAIADKLGARKDWGRDWN